MNTRRLLKAVKILAVVALAIVVFGSATMYLWNWLIPAIFHLAPITFTQALGLLILSKILFGGFHRHGGRRGRGREWRRHMQERFASMTPEERERFRSGMRGRHGWCRPTQPTTEPNPNQASA